MLENSRAPGLVELARLPAYTVADGDVDPRGWPVAAADGDKIGVVQDLVVDFAELRTRYLEVRLEGALHGIGDGAVLIPMQYVVLDARGSQVRVQGIAASHVATLPRYGGEVIAAERGNVFDRAAEAVADSPDRRADLDQSQR